LYLHIDRDILASPGRYEVAVLALAASFAGGAGLEFIRPSSRRAGNLYNHRSFCREPAAGRVGIVDARRRISPIVNTGHSE